MQLPIDTSVAGFETAATPEAPSRAPAAHAAANDAAGEAKGQGESPARPVLCEKLLDIAGVAESLGVTARHVRRLVTDRRIPYLKVGYFIRFDPAEVASWLHTHRVDARDRSVRKRDTRLVRSSQISAAGVAVRPLAPRATAGRCLVESGAPRRGHAKR